MSEARVMLVETADRLFAEHAARRGDPAAAWAAIEAAGFPLLLVPEAGGGFGGDWGDAVAVFRLAGRHALEVQLAEVVLANLAQAGSGLAVAGGLCALASRAEGRIADGRFSGRLTGADLPPGSTAALAELDGRLIRLPLAAATVETGANLAGETRATLVFTDVEVEQGAEAPGLFVWGALARAAQMAGALDGALAMSIEHVNARSQFGRPIGKFQAVQQSLAVFAAEAAAVNCAVEAAAQAADRGEAEVEVAAAKLRANRAAAVGVAAAHQAHGAIGFTRDHDLHRFTLRLNAWRMEYGADRLWGGRLGRRIAVLGAEGLWPELTRRSDLP